VDHVGDSLLDQFVLARNAYLQRKESNGGYPKLVSKLKENIQWLTEQRDAWKKAAETQEEHWKSLNQEIEEIRIGNAWLTEQRDAWKKAAETQEEHCKSLNQEIDEMRIVNSLLTEQRDVLEREAITSGTEIVYLSEEITKCHATLQRLQSSRIIRLLSLAKLLK
jgi:chromosome segregation ATPase